jgi:predicted DNA-binding protein with PD1-like motif/glutaredoxin
MRALPIHLEAGADLRGSLEALALEQQATGFVLSVVGNMSQACFACPGQQEPTVLRGELEIITLQGTVSPSGVHLHLSFSDPGCQVWGGHLEHGSLVLKGADLLVGVLQEAPHHPAAVTQPTEARVQVALAPGCAWSRRTERLLQGLGVTVAPMDPEPGALPQIRIDGRLIGGYPELAAMHSSGALRALLHG